MDSVGYLSPFVPPEWIAAHGLYPVWLAPDRRGASVSAAGHPVQGGACRDYATGVLEFTLQRANEAGAESNTLKRELQQPDRSCTPSHRGLCPCAGALIAAGLDHDAPAALVLTTACDQMRYASAYLEAVEAAPVFLLNVPSTWQSARSRQLYREELERLGSFLCTLGGRAPTPEQLRATIERFDARRAAALAARDTMSVSDWTALRSELPGTVPIFATAKPLLSKDACSPRKSDCPPQSGRGAAETETGTEVTVHRSAARSGFSAVGEGDSPIFAASAADQLGKSPCSPRKSGQSPVNDACDGIPLALLGGPLLAGDEALLIAVARAGGRIVLDGSEGGERTLPAPIDRKRLAADPLDALVRAYFDTIPDVFRRPNTQLYEWLGKHLPACGVRGILFRRNLFCDLWHAELHRLRAWSGLPVLELDAAAGDEGETNRAVGRIEAFLETVRQ